MTCYCDYDQPSIYCSRIVRARKEHRCYECGGRILAGDRYEYTFAIWNGDPGQIKTCAHCRDLRIWVKNNVPCLCIMHGDMDEQMSIAVAEARYRAREETSGLLFGFLRRIVSRNRFNKEREPT